jgi:peptide/nickel transport system ATP-binding protein
MLFITHDLSLLLEIADRIAIMYAGRIVELAGAEQLFRAPRHPYSAALLACFPSLHGERRVLDGIGGSPPDLGHPPPGCAFQPRCRFAIERCAQAVPPLAPPADPAGAGRTGAARSDRLVACWLHDGRELPDPLARPEPGQLEPGQPESGQPVPEAAKGGLR